MKSVPEHSTSRLTPPSTPAAPSRPSSPLLEGLTDAQRDAVTHTEGPLLIIAGAGSGKTRVLTRRVGYLLEQGVVPASILAITFTNKAAGEMKHRIGDLAGRPVRDFGKLEQHGPMVCTFHSLGLRILRFYAPTIGLPANFTIFDSADQQKLLKDAIKMLDLSSTNFPPFTLHSAISNAKNQLLNAEQYAATASDFYTKTVARVYRKYEQLLQANNAMDFDDLLLRTAVAMRDHPKILGELQERFGYILIDEYQDTNHAQYIVAHALAQKHRNICVVGDPDQSIYAWRGADIRNILDFEKDYPDAHVVKLEQNYRSTKTILSIASSLIANNRQRRDKGLWTENDQGEKAELFQCQDERDEATVIAERFKALHEQGMGWNQMAVFYRMNSLSRVMEDALRHATIPYVMARGVEFYNRKVIRDVLAYLRVIANPDDEVSLGRIVNTPPRGIGAASFKQLQTFALSAGVSLWQAMSQAQQVHGMSARAARSLQQFVAMVSGWRKLVEPDPASADVSPPADDSASKASRGRLRQLLEDVVRRSGMEAALKKESRDADTDDDPIDNVEELISSAAEFESENPQGTLGDYLAMVSLVSDTDRLKDDGGAVTLMTLHAAKGLEFPVVAIIGMEEGVLPHSRARDSVEELEEERRLCFVGITRARQRLILSKANYRTIRGLRDRTIGSPFLAELPVADLTVIDRTGVNYTHRDDDESDDDAGSATDRVGGQFRKGQLVRHPNFGLGRIADLSGAGNHARAIVDFNEVGKKTLVLQYARLERVDR